MHNLLSLRSVLHARTVLLLPVRYLVTGVLLCALFSVSAILTSAQAKELVIDRSFSTSYIDVPQTCELDAFKTTCTRLVNYYARRFEREMVSHLNYLYDGDDDLTTSTVLFNSRSRPKSVQHVKMSIYSQPGDPVLTMFSIFKQRIAGANKENLIVETINFEAETGKAIRFNQLFENSELAAMLCARAIEAKYTKFNSPLLSIVLSATELSPTNFIITPKGLRFFFAPGLVKPNTTVADSMLIRLELLQSAKPVEKWWAHKDDHVITAAERAALAASDLRDVINLDEDGADMAPVQRLADAKRAEQDAANAAAAIQDKSPTDAVAAPQRSPQVTAEGNQHQR
ncbi:MAG: hypothetical protein H9847_01975 [Candidatus Anaerobiospirillum pullicola]|uniref:Uncharacterized protein n=1 Tax=Candidatus Anaerobiospirillum pullicola TaxID=2838451 RepID=A0A948TF00_9GAMM|nr:hypothetical protein [Candidatus Anaerobiospirillum pullicola]